MKTKLLLLISFFAYQTLFAQTFPGIAVQGIARDAEKSALVDKQLTFTFDIQDPDGISKYKETEEITTDPYGVFSHIIGSGTPQGSGLFNEIPFGQAHMKLVISANGVVISDAPFQYAPYAKSAENGVPTGTIVAYAGTEANIPKGWTLCDGSDLKGVDGAGNLITLLGDHFAPDLRGMFLRGTGTNKDPNFSDNIGPDLNTTQGDAFEKHHHSIDNTTSEDTHDHTYYQRYASGGGNVAGSFIYMNDDAPGDGRDLQSARVSSSDTHSHKIASNTDDEGIVEETRPVNYGVHYIIKL